MAYPIADPKPLAPSAAAASYAVTVSGLGAVADDYVIIPFQCSATSGTLSETSGGATAWTLQTLYVTSGCRMCVAYAKVAAGPTISNPTFSLSAGTGMWQAAILVLSDVDATTFLAGSVATADPGALATTDDTGTMTPTSDNALVLYVAGQRGGTANACLRFLSSDVVGTVLQSFDDGSAFMGLAVGLVQQTAAAATAKTFYANASARLGSIVIPIKNKTSGKLSRHGIGGVTKVAWHGNFGTQHDATLTWGTPDNGGVTWDGAGAINGITVDAHVMTADQTVAGLAPFWGTWTTLAATLNTASAWVGRKATFSAAVNMTGKIFACELYLPLLGSQFGAEGVILAFKDSSGYWEAFQLSAKLGLNFNTFYTNLIDVENATPYASGGGGALNWADIVSITPFYHRAGSSATSRSIGVRNWNLISASTLVGGNSTVPLDITFLDKVLNGWGYSKLCELQGDAVMVKSDVQIGDGSFPTYYDATATLTNFPAAYDALLQRETNIPTDVLEIRIKAGASDTINETASATAAALEQDWIIDATSSGSATYSVNGKSFVNVRPTLLAGETFTGATWSGCDTLNTKGANLASCTISNTTSTGAAVACDGSGSTLTGTTIDVTGTSAAYHLELGTAVTAITLADVTFTGTPATDKVHVLKTTGTVTITISGSTSLVAGDVTSAGATVVIAAPTPTLDATVLASSRVVLYNNTTAAELDNTAPAGTSWSKTITSGASSGDSLTLHAFKEGYEEFSTTFLYTGDDATILVTQVVQADIAALRTELGITDYTTITEFALDITGTVEIDADDADGSTQKARLVIWYNGILTTENGARYLRGAISILSTAAFRINVDVLDLNIENISVTQGLNFTDTERRLYRSDGTAIYAAASAPGSIQNDYSGVPDTVETGVSGLTGTESAQLMAIPTTAAPSAATVADAVWAKTLP